jgi:HK97 family phage portal protein
VNRLLARVAGLESRAAEVVHPAAMPTAALALRTANPGQPLYPRQNPDTAVEWGYWANLYAYRCVNTIAATVAGLPFRGSAEADGHPDPTSVLGQLLGPAPGGPNAYWSSALLWRYLVAQWLVQGRFALLKQYTDGDLVGLFPLQVQGLFPIPAETGDSPFSHFEYLRGTPYYREFLPGELVYCWNPSQLDWRQPESVLGPAARTVNLMKLLEDFDTSFLVNGGVPAYLVTTDAFAQKDDRARFRQQFDRFTGAANAGQVMFAERVYDPGEGTGTPNDPVSINTVGINQRDAELSALRDNKIRDLCVAFGVPLSLLGDSSLTRFHQTAEDRQFYYTETIKPLISGLADQVNIALGAELAEYGWFETTGIRELARERVFTNDAVAAELVAAELITRDEWRADAGLPPAAKVGLSGQLARPPAAAVGGAGAGAPNGAAPPASAPPPPPAAPAPASAPARAEVIDIRALAVARRGEQRALPKTQKCEYCDNQATQRVIHSEGMAYVPACDEHLGRAKDDAAHCTPDGTNDPSNINAVRPIRSAGEARHAGPDGHVAGITSGHVTLATLQHAYTVRLRRFLAQQADAVGKRLTGRRRRQVRAAMVGNVEALYDVGWWIAEGQRLFPEQADAVREAVLQTAADLADAIAAGASDEALVSVIERSAAHYRLAA